VRRAAQMLFAAGVVFVSFLLVIDRVEASQEANCTLRKIPIISLMVACQQKTPERVEALKRYWREEDTRTLCHYFYFPIVDPRAARSLLAANFSIMAEEIAERGVDCKKDYSNIIWYRGPNTRSMLEKYPLAD